MSTVCHLYVLICHPYVTRMYSNVIRMLLVCTRTSLVCGFTMNRSLGKDKIQKKIRNLEQV